MNSIYGPQTAIRHKVKLSDLQLMNINTSLLSQQELFVGIPLHQFAVQLREVSS
jgi:hypothetical protein